MSFVTVAPVLGSEQWVTSISTSHEWAVFQCKDRWITTVCGTDKDYLDPGALPSVISVGDTIGYTDRQNELKQFVVRQISFFVYEKDVDFTYGSKRLTARKGDTTCTLYEVKNRADTAATKYPPRIVVRQCRVLR
jgi:hypothetical protein